MNPPHSSTPFVGPAAQANTTCSVSVPLVTGFDKTNRHLGPWAQQVLRVSVVALMAGSSRWMWAAEGQEAAVPPAVSRTASPPPAAQIVSRESLVPQGVAPAQGPAAGPAIGQALARLKTQLQLRPEQQAVWEAFATAHQPPGGAAAQKTGRNNTPPWDEWAQLPTPERLDRMQAFKAQMDERHQQKVSTTRALYAQLDAEQKTIFDTQTARLMRVMVEPHRPGAAH